MANIERPAISRSTAEVPVGQSGARSLIITSSASYSQVACPPAHPALRSTARQPQAHCPTAIERRTQRAAPANSAPRAARRRAPPCACDTATLAVAAAVLQECGALHTRSATCDCRLDAKSMKSGTLDIFEITRTFPRLYCNWWLASTAKIGCLTRPETILH
jgi:hypothetical protein